MECRDDRPALAGAPLGLRARFPEHVLNGEPCAAGRIKPPAPADLLHEVGIAEDPEGFLQQFREDLRYWVETNRRGALRTFDLVEAILRDPFRGIGKPEPLKYVLAGAWSGRLTEEHRLVYLVSGNRIDFLQARYHY